jgi:hypothetical protein
MLSSLATPGQPWPLGQTSLDQLAMDQGDLTPPDPTWPHLIVDLSTINPMENYQFVDDLPIFALKKQRSHFPWTIIIIFQKSTPYNPI